VAFAASVAASRTIRMEPKTLTCRIGAGLSTTLALALPRCRLVTCDAFMADVVRRSGVHVLFRCELYTGRRADVDRLRERLDRL
jgi:hypothetical protein